MQLFPVSFVIVLLFLLAIRGGLERGAFLAIALLPFGMTAFANLPAMGNLSLPASQVVAGCTIGLMVLVHLVRTPLAVPRLFDPASRPLLLLGLYAVFSGIVLVRLFEYQLYVVPLNKAEEGVRLSPLFGSRATLLEANASNISQMFYLVFSIAFFFLCRRVLRARGTGYAHAALVTAATINLVLGAIDALQLDVLLQPLRTAKYALLDTHAIAGLPRIIGGFPEASTFGAFSVTMTAYFAAHYLYAGGRRSALLTLGCASASVGSLSSTSYFGLGVAVTGLVAGAVVAFLGRAVPPRHLVLLHVAVLGAVTLVFVYIAIGPPEVLVEILDKLLFDKAGSSSGLERGAWAEMALRAFAESHWLGVGVGSLRGNGLASVYLGSMGIPGTFLFALFLLRTLTRGRTRGMAANESERAVANGATLALLTWLATALVSATTPDPGLLAMLFCAILVTVSAPVAAAAPVAARTTDAGAGRPALDRPAVGIAPAVPEDVGELELMPVPFVDLGDPEHDARPDGGEGAEADGSETGDSKASARWRGRLLAIG